MELTLVKESKNRYAFETPLGVYGRLSDVKKKDAKILVKFLEGIGHIVNRPKYWRD